MNLKELNFLIEDSGMTYTSIAGKMGITRYTLSKKLNGETEFKLSEMNRLSDILNMSPGEKIDIFFPKECELNSHKI